MGGGVEELKAIKNKLAILFNVDLNRVPKRRAMRQWASENECGFLCGVTEHGEQNDRRAIAAVLDQPATGDQEKRERLKTMIPAFKRYYIDVFKRPWTQPRDQYDSSSRSESARTLTEFEDAVQERDGVCLFCWSNDTVVCHVAHITN